MPLVYLKKAWHGSLEVHQHSSHHLDIKLAWHRAFLGSCRAPAPCVQVEMYADPIARGGVLEPEGMVEIKFRTPDLVKAMHRLDPVIAGFKAEDGPDADAAIRAREAALLPVYRQVGLPSQEGKEK